MALLAVHTNLKRFQCEQWRSKVLAAFVQGFGGGHFLFKKMPFAKTLLHTT